MKFKDIPRFTEAGTYETAVGLKYIESALADFKESYNLELNPDFQRGNVWTENQQIKWLEFFLRGGRTSRTIYFNCATFRSDPKPNCDIPNMVCVDGLQRLTAILRFLHNEIPAFGAYYNEYEDSPSICDINLLINVNELQTRKEVITWYLEMNTGGTVHSDEEINRVQKLLDSCT